MGRILAGVLCLGGIWTMASCTAPPEPEENVGLDQTRPDVLLVTFCTMRADRFGAYGGGELTPTIDALSHEGVVFRNHYTQASFSGTSFASIITGKYPFGHGIYDHPRRLADENVTLAEMFKEAGYATGGFLTHTYLRPKWNYQQGLDTYNGYDLKRLSLDALMSRKAGSARDQVREALLWVDQLDDRPYFIWFQTHLSHYFPQVKPPFVSEEDFGAARAFKRRTEGLTASQRMFSIETLGVLPEEERGYLATYDGAVARSDHLLGELISGLEEMGRFVNTIVLVTADHGETLGEKGLFSTHDSNLLEPTVRIPLVLRLPGGEPGEVRAVTRNIDLTPTLAALAGLDVPADLHGQSLVPLLDGKELNLAAFSETRPKVVERGEFARYRLLIPGIEGKLRSIRRDNYKLTVFPTPDGHELELYDLDLDPSETTNLATELPDVTRRLARELGEWFAGYADTDTSPLELDAEDLESLRALGYID